MQTRTDSWIKLHGTKLLGILAIVGLVVLSPFLINLWLVMTDSIGTFHNRTDVADLDGDGDLDVVMHNVRKESEFTAFSVMTLWVNQNEGQFEAHRLGDAEFGPGMGSGWASAVGDLDLDGDVDLLVFPGLQLSLLQNQGGGPAEFGRAKTINNLGGDGQYGSLALGDLNNDRLLDGIIAGCCGRQFNIEPEGGIPNNSWAWINALSADGSLIPQTSIISALDSLAMQAVALGDLDGDDDLDLFAAVLASSFNPDPADRVLFNDGSENFIDSGQRLGDTDSTAVTLGDLDDDGDMDALVAAERQAVVWINQGGSQGGREGTFAPAGQEISGSKIRSVFLSDLDADGDLDAVIAGIRQAVIWWNDGQAAFTRSGQRFNYSRRYGLAIGDFNSDGWPDIFIAKYSNDYRIMFNQGDGTFR